MAKVDVYTISGSKTETLNLPDGLFGVQASPSLIAEVIRVQDANSRVACAHTKDRSEVRGGGKKPWKQKGTGRARHGSRRSPIWIGGGITFGPNNLRNFLLKINKKAKRKALACALSDKVASNQFIVLNEIKLSGETKELDAIRKSLPGNGETALIVTASDELNVVRAAKNLEKTSTIAATSLNIKDLLKSKFVIASKAAVDKMIEVYAS
jgi:large subunit ribosomal protein L4